MQIRRLKPDEGSARLLGALNGRIKHLETRPSGVIYVSDKIVAEDPETGVEIIIGRQPDGSWGTDEWVNDVTPPGTPSTPTAVGTLGGVTITWDGLEIGGLQQPKDYLKTEIEYSDDLVVWKSGGTLYDANSYTVPGLEIGTEYGFRLISYDKNRNMSTPSVAVAATPVSFVDNSDVQDALNELRAEDIALNAAVVATQENLTIVSDAADAAEDAALEAVGFTNGTGVILYQDNPPVGATNTVWIDTNDGNKAYIWNGTAWTLVTGQAALNAIAAAGGAKALAYVANIQAISAAQVAGDAQQSANNKNRTYYLPDAPAGNLHTVGDIWFDTSEGNLLHRWNGASWVSVQDAAIASLDDRVDQVLTSVIDKSKTYYQAAMPTGGTYNKGDIWFDTDDGYKVYVYNGTIWQNSQDSAIASLNTAVNLVTTTADKKNTIYYQADMPAGTAHKVNDQWFDSDDGNKVYRWNGTTWVSIQDAAIAALNTAVTNVTTTANSKNTVYYNPTMPAGTAYKVNDQWFDSDDGNKLYRWNGTTWVTIQDGAIAALNTAVNRVTLSSDEKSTVYYQTAKPTGGTYKQGDTWFDTDDGNKVYVHNGTDFVSARDAAIAIAQTRADDAYVVADGKNKVYYQAAQPTGGTYKQGDTWFDTDDSYKLYTYTGTIWQLAQNSAGALATANSKTKTYFQTAQPSLTGNTVGDTWFDTDDGNKIYVWNGSTWFNARDSGISAAASASATAQETASAALTAAQAAQAVADGAIRTFYQATAPTGLNNTTHIGDLWFDTDDDQAYRWNGTTWIVIQDNAIATALAAAQNAQTTADGKITSFYQPGQPAVAEVGDLWFDTDDKNRPYYCSSASPVTWVPVRDGAIADAAQLASTALTSANGKNKTYYSTSMPTGGTYVVGDTWFDTDDGNKIYIHNGSTFIAYELGSGAIANAAITSAKIGDAQITSAKISALDAGKITTGTLDAGRIGADSINATHMAANAITAENAALADASIVSAKIQDAAITTAKIGDAQITDAKISTLNAGKITAGILDANRIGANSIVSSKLAVTDLTDFAPNWDEAPDDWEYTANGFQLIVTDLGDRKTRPRTTATSGNSWMRGPFRSVHPGEKLYAEAVTYKIGTGQQQWLRYEWYDKNKSSLGQISQSASATSPTGTKFVIDGAVVPAGTVYARLTLFATPGASNTEVGFYSVQGYKQVGTTLIENGVITTDKIISTGIDAGVIKFGQMSGDRIEAKTIGADKLLVGFGSNFVADPTFENDLINTYRTTGNSWVVGTSPEDGKFLTTNSTVTTSMPLNNNESGYWEINPTSIYALTVDASGLDQLEAFLTVRYANGVANSPGSSIVQIPITGGRGLRTVSWNMADYTNNGSVAKEVYVILRRKATPAGQTNFFTQIYSARFVEKITGEVIVNGTITSDNIAVSGIDAGKVTFGEMDGARIKAGSIFANQLVIGQNTNLIPNGFGEMGNNTNFDGYTFSSADVPNNALGSFTHSTAANLNHSNTGGKISVEPGGKYTFSVWLKADAPNSRMFIEIMEDNGILPVSPVYPVSSVLVPTVWTKFSTTVTMGADVSRIYFRTFFNHANGTAVTTQRTALWGLYKQVDSTIIEDGAVTTDKIIATGINAGVIKFGEMDGARIKANTLLASQILVGEFDNLVPDPYFLGDPTAPGAVWSGQTGAYSIDPTGSRLNTPAFKIVNAAVQQGKYSTDIKVQPDESYFATVWVKSDVDIPANGLGIYLATYPSAAATGGSAVNIIDPAFSVAIPANTWKMIKGSRKLPSNTVRARIGLFSQTAFSTGSVWFDSPTLTRMSGTTLIEGGAITTDKIISTGISAGVIQFGELDGGLIRANSVSAKAIAVGDFTDLVDNGGFEFDLKGWAPNTATTAVSIDTVSPQSGLKSVKLTGTAAIIQDRPVDVVPGEKLRVSGYYKASSNKAGTGGARMQSQTGGEGVTWSETAVGSAYSFGTATTWTYFSGTVTVNAGVTSLRPRIATAFSAGSVNVDGFSVRRMADATLIEGGAINTTHIISTGIDAAVLKAGTIDADRIGARTINASKLVIGQGPNLLVDPGFYDANINAARIARSSGAWTTAIDTHNSLQSMRKSPTNTTNDQFYFGTYPRSAANAMNMIPCSPGQKYLFQADTWTSASAGVRFDVEVVYSDGTTSYLAGVSPYNVANGWRSSSNSTPNPVTYEWTVPARVVAFSVGMSCNTSGINWIISGNALVALKSTGALIVDGAIDGKTITGALIQSESATYRGIKFSANQLVSYDTSGLSTGETFRIDGNNGNVSMRGSIQSGSTVTGSMVTGGVIQTSMAIDVGIKLIGSDASSDYPVKNTLLAYGPNGVLTARINGVSNLLTGRLQTNEMGQPGVILIPKTTTGLPGVWFSSDGTASGDEAAIYSDENWALNIRGKSSPGRGSGPIRVHGGLNVFGTINGYASGVSSFPSWAIDSGGSAGFSLLNVSDFYLNNPPTATFASNMGLATSPKDRVYKVGSRSDLKLAQQPLSLERAKDLLKVEPITWFDRYQTEAYAAYISGNGPDLEDIAPLVRIPGATAENVLEAGLTEFVVFDQNGELESIAYDRLMIPAITLIKDLYERIEQLEKQFNEYT